MIPDTIRPPMRRLAVLLLFLTPLTANAWTRASDTRIAERSMELAPPDLQLVLKRFAPEFANGLQRAESDEGSEVHHYFVLSRQGKLRERIEQETRGTIAMVRGNQSMALVAEHLGTLAHLVADANNPFHTSDADPRLGLMHDDFEQYFERRMAHFPTVFYGLSPDFQLDAYLDRTVNRSSRLMPLMSEEYFRGGSEHRSVEFDDRSTAFGVASVCYSHAVTDLVNLYYYIWRESGGDVRSAATRRPAVMRSGQ
jgi:hypothetical protein